MSNPWFRAYAEFATDPKIQMMNEADQRRFVMILCLRCSNGDVTLHDEAVAFQLRVSIDEWTATKARLVAKGLIDEGNKPIAWNKRQYVSDTSKNRVSKHRLMKKNGMKRPCNVTVTHPETETDTETESETESETEQTNRAPEAKPNSATDKPNSVVEVSQSAAPDDLKSAFNGTTDAMLGDLVRWMAPHGKLDNARKWLSTTLSASGRDATINAYQALVAGQGQGVPIADPIRYWAKTAQTMQANGGRLPQTARKGGKETLSEIIAQRKAAREAAGVQS